MNLPISTNQDLTMSSFDLFTIVNQARESEGEKKTRLNQFSNRIIDELDGEDYQKMVVQNLNGTESFEFMLTVDQCMLIAMRESKAVRKSVLAKVRDLEARQAPKLPQSFSEALQLAADQAKQLELAAPKVEFHDTVVQSDHTYKFQEAGKKIQQRPNKFVKWLRDNGYLMKNNIPYQQYVDLGVMIIHTGINGEGFEFTQGRITTKGLSYFTKKLDGITL